MDYDRADARLMRWATFWAVICVLAGVRLGRAPEGTQWIPFLFLLGFTAAGAAHAIIGAWKRR